MSISDQGISRLYWVQVRQRLLQGRQASDPHLRGGESVIHATRPTQFDARLGSGTAGCISSGPVSTA